MKTAIKGLVVGLTLVMAFAGCGKGKAGNININGVTGPTVNFDGKNFTYSMVIQSFAFNVGATIPIPNLPNSSMSATPDLQTNGMLLSLTISAADLSALLNVNPMAATTLPGGRPLPGLAAGDLPGVAISIPHFDNVVFYAGNNIFGLFVPVKLGISTVIATYQFYSPTGSQIGNISLVGSDATGANAGVLLLINVAGEVASDMEKALK